MKPVITRRLGVSDDPTANRPSLRETLEMVLEQAAPLITFVLDGLAGKAGAGSANSAPKSPQAMAALAVLGEHRDAVRDSFVAHLRDEMYSGVARGAAAAPMMRFDSLQMLEEDQLDESIEIARAQQEVAFSVDDVLPALDALMSAQLGWLTVQPQINPLRPEVFVRALRASLAEHVTDPAARDAVITPAAGRLGVNLNRLYRDISEWLRSSGVEPVTQISAAVQARTPPKPGSVANTILTLDRLRKLLAGELGEGSGLARGPGQDFLHTVPASFEALQDMKQVEAMMQRLARKAKAASDNPQGAAPAPSKADLADSRQLGKHLGQEVVRLMVENLTQDERLLPRVRAHLQLLEPMLMDLAQADPKFFNDRQHPARRFVERVTHRSLGFATEKDEGFAVFERSVEKAIAALQQHAKDGVAPFGPVIERLEAAWSRADAVERQRREEAARALLHAEQRNLLAQKYAEDFRARFEKRDVPPFIASFLCGPWAHAVAESELKATHGEVDTDGFLALVDDLLWSIQSKSARRNRARLVGLIPELLGKLRQGLKSIDYPAERIPVFFDDLIGLHEALLEDTRPRRAEPVADSPAAAPAAGKDAADGADAAGTPPTSGFDSAPPEEIWLGHKEAQESGFLDEAAIMPLDLSDPQSVPEAMLEPAAELVVTELGIGAWVEIMIDGAWVRAQLSWASPHRSLFMFTSSHGGAAHSMTRRTMDRLRAQGLIRVVSDGEMVDQALDAVAQAALRNSLEPPSGG